MAVHIADLDFAGGGPVHISSGWSALAYALVPGKRNHRGEASHGKAHNTKLVSSEQYSYGSGGLVLTAVRH